MDAWIGFAQFYYSWYVYDKQKNINFKGHFSLEFIYKLFFSYLGIICDVWLESMRVLSEFHMHLISCHISICYYVAIFLREERRCGFHVDKTLLILRFLALNDES